VPATSAFAAFVTRFYDKVIALAAVITLLAAIGTLVIGQRRGAAEEQAYLARLDALKPAHPTLEPISLVTHSNALRQLAAPYRIAIDPGRPAGFFVPESRVWCANRSCLKPIPLASTNCPFCQTEQPVELKDVAGYDGDGGGIPDKWESQHNLDPLDPVDDTKDSDGDGFNNLAEFKAGTNPLDPRSHPDRLGLLRVGKIEVAKLPIKFMAVIKMPHGHRIQMNVLEPGAARPSTYFVVTNQMIGKTDFKLLSYIETKERRPSPVTKTLMDFTIQKVQIGRGGKIITLGIGEDASESDYRITFVQTLDGTSFETAGDGQFTLDGKRFRVIAVDNQAASVVLQNDADKMETTVPKL
jgi:hypothetical protein